MFRQIKWAWQRVFRGYDDRILGDFECYLHFVPKALKEFLTNELSGNTHLVLNGLRKEKYTQMLKLINDYYISDGMDDEVGDRMWSYFGENIGWFWN